MCASKNERVRESNIIFRGGDEAVHRAGNPPDGV